MRLQDRLRYFVDPRREAVQFIVVAVLTESIWSGCRTLDIAVMWLRP
jgi:hypothetical protein